MAADYNKPITTDNYADILTQLRDNIAAAQTMLNDLTGVANIPTDAVRYDQTLNKLQSYNGSTFVDLILSPAGGGTGITNWAKASTAEAEAGAANKYPDAAGVHSAIAAVGYNAGNSTVVWTGTASTVSLDLLPGGHPGDGWYLFADSSGVTGHIYVKQGTFTANTYMLRSTVVDGVTCTGDDITVSSYDWAGGTAAGKNMTEIRKIG